MEGGQKDVLGRLADRGEQAVSRLAEVAGGTRFLEAANVLRERLDELQKRVRGLDVLERRVDALERRLDEVAAKAEAGTRSRARSGTTAGTRARRTTGAGGKPPTRKKGPGGTA